MAAGLETASDVHAAAKEALEAKIYEDPRVGSAWLELIALVRHGERVDEVRDVYDRFFEYFPQASTQWMDYIDWELSRSNFEQVNAIFSRCLRTTLSVDLWKMYLAYIRRVNPLPPYTAEENSPRDQTRRVLEQSYEFALKHMGWDRESGPIWQDYLQLLREREVRGSWQEGQKMDQLRRVFQRAVCIPLNQVEAIWRDYDAYETSLNKITAKKFLGERSPAYMQARAILKELRGLTDNLVKPALPVQPCWILPNGKTPAEERQSLQAWHRYLEWEEKNPLALDDAATLQHRVLSAYRKATMYVRFDAVVWYMAAMYCQSVKRDAEALAWLREGTDACPWSILLRFQYAEMALAQGQGQDASASLDDLLMYMHHQIDVRLEAQRAACAAVDAEMDAERETALQKRAQDDAPDDEDADKAALADIERRMQETRSQRQAQVQADARPALDEWRDALSQVWIKYMQLMRRAEGIRSARQVFGRARKSPHCTWQVYEANAMLEYHCSKDETVATKVFELALRIFGPDEQLVVRYLDFLISINDDTNARAVLERTVSSMPVDKAKAVWMRWADYEYSYGDTSALARLDARLMDAYPDMSRLDRAANRWRYGALDYVRVKDLGYARAAPQAAKDAKESSFNEVTEEKAPRTKTPVPEPAPKVEKGGRQSMEEIRRALAASSEPVKRTRPKAEAEKTSKKRKEVQASDSVRRAVRETPPPVPALPEAVLYFMSAGYVSETDAAIWFKYPNPYAEHVRSIDVLQHHIDPSTGVVQMERLIGVDQSTPGWIRKLLGVKDCTYVREVIRFDPHMPCIDMESMNLSFNHYLLVTERIRYMPADEHTRFDQMAEFDCRGLRSSYEGGFWSSAARKVEEATVDLFKKNAARGRQGFSHVLQAMFQDKSLEEYEAQVLIPSEYEA